MGLLIWDRRAGLDSKNMMLGILHNCCSYKWVSIGQCKRLILKLRDGFHIIKSNIVEPAVLSKVTVRGGGGGDPTYYCS